MIQYFLAADLILTVAALYQGVNYCEDFIVVTGHYKGTNAFGSHFEGGYFITLAINVLPGGKTNWAETLPNQTQQPFVTQLPEKRMIPERPFVHE